MIDHRLLLTTCLLSLSLLATPAVAQQAPAEEAAATGGLDTIVVTAQRRKEKLQDVPVTVTAFGEATIEQLHLNDALTTSKFVPGMISQHNAGLASANAYYLRGLGNSQSTPTFDAPVTTYVDDIYVARQNANNYAFFDTERVEVLRGPQGTLFGRNTTGGAVAVIMRKPQDNFGLKAEATVGSYSRYTIKGSVDAPISPMVLTKLSAYYVSDDGFLKNITTKERLNGEKNWGVRGDVRLLPAEGLTIDASIEYTVNDSTYFGMRTEAGANPYIPGGTTRPVFYETAAGLQTTGCSDNNVNTLLTTGKGMCNLSKSFAGSLNVAYDVGAGTINYIFGYRHLDQGYINQYDANTANKYAAFILTDNGIHRQWSHELKYNTNLFDNRVHLVTGLFYLKEKSDDRQTTFSGGTTSFKIAQDQHLLPQTETFAGYAQADFDVTQQLTFTTGGRYTWERKKVDYLLSSQFPGFGYTGAQVAAFGIPLQQTYKKFTPRVALSYKVDPDVLLFASATNGFKSGGWNGGAAAPANAVVFNPEKTWSFESGMKSEFFNHKLRFNITGYYAKTKDLQVTAGVVSPVTGLIASLPFNAGTFEAYGVEVESSARLGDFSLFANPSLMHGAYTYIVPTATVLNTGFKPVRVPSFQFSGGITWERQVESLGGSVGATATYRHNSPYWVAVLNTTKTTVENFVDASISYKLANDMLKLSFEVSNLTEQKTVTANFLSLFPGEPRRFTARVSLKI
jgi:iron complex outermembrane receptor protein